MTGTGLTPFDFWQRYAAMCEELSRRFFENATEALARRWADPVTPETKALLLIGGTAPEDPMHPPRYLWQPTKEDA